MKKTDTKNLQFHDRQHAAPEPPAGSSEPSFPVSPDSEILIHKAFEHSFDEGIEMLYRWYYVPLCNHAIRFVLSREAAEDIVSEVFSSFYNRKSGEKLQGSFRAYLFASVRNRAYNYVRFEMQRNLSLDKADRLSALDQQPDEITEYEDLYQYIERTVNALPVRQRNIYMMCRVDGKKYEEVADELNISLKTVKEHMYRALQHLRKAIREKWPVSLAGLSLLLEHL